RDLCEHFALKPARGMRKVAILDDADDLNEEAANAFLKTLEEPPPGAVLILIGTSVEVQLQTIVSRCQVVRFDPLSASDVAELLLEQGVALDAGDARRRAGGAGAGWGPGGGAACAGPWGGPRRGRRGSAAP